MFSNLQLILKKTKDLFRSLTLSVLYFTQASSFAYATNAPKTNSGGLEGLADRLANIINFALSLAIPIAVIALVIVGYQYITAAGNAEAIQRAKTNFFWIIAGLIVIIAAKSLLVFVLGALGIKYSLFGL